MLADFLVALIMLTNFTLVVTNRINKAIQIAVLQPQRGDLLGDVGRVGVHLASVHRPRQGRHRTPVQ